MRLIDADELIITILTNDLCDDDNVDKAILNAPTIKAIPVKWVENYIKQNYCDCDLVYPEGFLKELVTWWEEENE